MTETPLTETGRPSPAVNNQQPMPRSNGDYNRAAIRRHALKVSTEDRLGKFTRVGEEFINTVEANIEAFIRTFRRDITTARLKQVQPDEGEKFLTGAGEQKLIEAFNLYFAREIHRQVNKVPCGKTL